jgi:Flp pilus assembly pilin Flp
MLRTRDDSNERHGQGMIEYGILLGTLALGVVLTLVAIGAQIRTLMPDSPPSRTGEP